MTIDTAMLESWRLAVMYCFVFLYFVFAGAGAWSVDSLRSRSAFAEGSTS